jgi:hypothetical protein
VVVVLQLVESIQFKELDHAGGLAPLLTAMVALPDASRRTGE